MRVKQSIFSNSHVSFSLPHCLNVYPSNLPLIPSSFLPFMFVSPSASLSLPISGANIPYPIYPSLLPLAFSLRASLYCSIARFLFILIINCPLCLYLFVLHPLSLLPLPVCDSQERGEECSQHVRSPKVPPGSGEQWSVVIIAPGGAEPRL